MSSRPPETSGWREAERLAALASYEIMDTAPEAGFDDVVRVAAQICGAPMALISLVDDKRQWFKAALGLTASETPREVAFCAHAIQHRDIMVVQDARQDARFEQNPLVTGELGLRFYAGAPLETPDGLPLGTLCVLDTRPGKLTEDQQFALQALARQVVVQLELRKALARQTSLDERHRLILASAIDYAIISMDLDGVVATWNQGAENILGWTEEQMRGQTCEAFFTPEDRAAGVPANEMRQALADGRGSDERWHLRKGGERFWASGEMMMLANEAGAPIGFLKILRDRTDVHRAQEALRLTEEAAAHDTKLLSNELQHRVKNTLAIVQSIVLQTLRRASTPAEAAKTIEDRLISLARANDVLTIANRAAAPITGIIEAATRIVADPGRIRWSGPAIDLKARAALGLTLAIHELSTNAVKYGALSNSVGTVDIAWALSGDGPEADFTLTWTERGGPEVSEPTHRGFGSRLIQTGLGGGSGDTKVEFRREGIIFQTHSRRGLIEDR